MSITDPIADMLTCIRNANRIHRNSVEIPSSKIKEGIAEVLKREGFIREFKIMKEAVQARLRLYLKYGPDGEFVIHRIDRISKPGRRVYAKVKEIEPILNGMGISILSTPSGILSDRECRHRRVGGEILCNVW